MNKYENKLDDLLRESKTVLVRERRHRIFRLEDGQNFVVAKTPSTQGSAKKSLGTLKRLIANSHVDTPKELKPERAVAELPPKKRFITPNNPPRKKKDAGFQNLSDGNGPTTEIRIDTTVRLRNVIELLMAADKSDEFWALDSSGRIRALKQIAESFAKVEVLAVQFCRASVEEVCRHYGLGQDRDHPDYNKLETILSREGPLSIKMLTAWGGLQGIPSLLIHDPILGEVLVETSAWSVLEKTDYIFLWYGELHGTSYGISSHVWDPLDPTKPTGSSKEPDHFIYSSFVSRRMMERKSYKLLTSASWTDPNSTRAAIRQILEIARNQAADHNDVRCEEFQP